MREGGREGADHFVASLSDAPLGGVDELHLDDRPVGQWLAAWQALRREPLFWIAALLLVMVATVSIAPELFTHVHPSDGCTLDNSNGPPAPGHILGFTMQGCDVFSRVVYGARASVTVGLFSTLGSLAIGGTLGALAGYYGGVLDAVLSRLTDIFFALPLVLAAVIVMQLPLLREHRTVWTVVLTLSVFGWPQIARITRGAVIEVRGADFVTAARSLGVSRGGALLRHVLPNAAAPVIVTSTLALGVFIVTEATLSFLGIGLPPGTVSWGNDISDAQNSLRYDPAPLLWPAAALSLTVLAFIMMGDAVRDALDPRARRR